MRGASTRPKAWHLEVPQRGEPLVASSETLRLLRPYSLIVQITYKDIYSQEGRTTYEASHAASDFGVELTELIAPRVELGAEVKPIVFRRSERQPIPAG